MNQRTVSNLARALGVSIFALIVAACAAPVGNESEGTSEEAVRVKCANDIDYLVCPGAGALGTSALEQGLADFGCSGKVVIDGEGQGKDALFQTTCSGSGQHTFACGERCVFGIDGPRYCVPRMVTGYLYDFLQCHKTEASGSTFSACT